MAILTIPVGILYLHCPNQMIMHLNNTAARNWLRGLGIVGFLFFLAKGLVWLSLAALVFASKGCHG